ncbi:MAG: hypothetical protein JJT82_07475 [Legionellaceae bacterium]|nr:hypothetical protein [Legionellaceae bacterium]
MPLPLIVVPLVMAAKPAAVWVGYYVLGGAVGGALGGGGIVGGAWYFLTNSNKPHKPNNSNEPNNSPNQEVIDAMMKLGNYYQVDHKKDDSRAFDAYLKAAQQGGEEALIPLERLGEEMGTDKQLLLSELYKTVFKNDEKAKYWQEKAAELAQFDNLAL